MILKECYPRGNSGIICQGKLTISSHSPRESRIYYQISDNLRVEITTKQIDYTEKDFKQVKNNLINFLFFLAHLRHHCRENKKNMSKFVKFDIKNLNKLIRYIITRFKKTILKDKKDNVKVPEEAINNDTRNLSQIETLLNKKVKLVKVKKEISEEEFQRKKEEAAKHFNELLNLEKDLKEKKVKKAKKKKKRSNFQPNRKNTPSPNQRTEQINKKVNKELKQQEEKQKERERIRREQLEKEDEEYEKILETWKQSYIKKLEEKQLEANQTKKKTKKKKKKSIIQGAQEDTAIFLGLKEKDSQEEEEFDKTLGQHQPDSYASFSFLDFNTKEDPPSNGKINTYVGVIGDRLPPMEKKTHHDRINELTEKFEASKFGGLLGEETIWNTKTSSWDD